MQHLMDFSTLRSVSKGLGDYGFYRYMREAGGTEGVTQLIDIARLVDLVVLSDKIVVSERSADVDVPNEIADILRFIPLDDDPSYFPDVGMYADDLEELKAQ